MATILKASRGARCSCFITGALADSRGTLLTRHVGALRAALREVQRLHRFRVDAFVVLPDHLHALCSSRCTEAEPAMSCCALAEAFARHAARPSPHDIKRDGSGPHEIRLRLHWHYAGRREEDVQRLIDHIHLDPVHHGLVTSAAFWPWSSHARHLQSAAALPERQSIAGAANPSSSHAPDEGSHHAFACR